MQKRASSKEEKLAPGGDLDMVALWTHIQDGRPANFGEADPQPEANWQVGEILSLTNLDPSEGPSFFTGMVLLPHL